MSSPRRLYVQIGARVGTLRIEVEIASEDGAVVVVGPNGAGKSSLLALVLGARPLERGRIELAGAVLCDSAAGIDVPVELRRIGYVPQDYALFPHMTVRENVRFALRSAHPRLDREARERRIDALLEPLALGALGDRRPSALSAGERQRAALARALVIEPRALLLDEPLAALDVHARREVREFLAAYLRDLPLPVLIVTHDPEDARALGRRIVALEQGRVTQAGSWDELVARPATRFVAELVRA